MTQAKDLIVIGNGRLAQLSYEYFNHDSEHQVVAFSVERDIMVGNKLFDCPVIPFEELEGYYDPDDYVAYVGIGFVHLNRVRARMCERTKEKGYKLVSYVSTSACISEKVVMGENCFVFEQAQIQPWVKIGNNVTICASVGIGQHSVIEDNVFFAGHSFVGERTHVGRNSMLGGNCTVLSDLEIAPDTIVGASALITKNTVTGRVYKGCPPVLSRRNSFEVFGVKESEI